MALPAAPRKTIPSEDHDHVVLLRNTTWSDFQRHLEIRGTQPVPRIAYLEGVLELMSPSRWHESKKSMIGRLLEAWCFEMKIDISPYGSWTLENKEAERGAEPDECYVVGDRPDPTMPDLVIEVVQTSGGVSKLDIYRKLGVREVWFYQHGVFSLHALRGEQYERIAASEVLAGIDLHLLAQYIDQQPMTRAVRAFREALRSRQS